MKKIIFKFELTEVEGYGEVVSFNDNSECLEPSQRSMFSIQLWRHKSNKTMHTPPENIKNFLKIFKLRKQFARSESGQKFMEKINEWQDNGFLILVYDYYNGSKDDFQGKQVFFDMQGEDKFIDIDHVLYKFTKEEKTVKGVK